MWWSTFLTLVLVLEPVKLLITIRTNGNLISRIHSYILHLNTYWHLIFSFCFCCIKLKPVLKINFLVFNFFILLFQKRLCSVVILTSLTWFFFINYLVIVTTNRVWCPTSSPSPLPCISLGKAFKNYRIR